MSNIREVQFAKPQANEDVVQMLEEWLARARNGQVKAMALAGVKTDGGISTEWRGLSNGGFHEMNSAIAILAHRVLISNIEPEA